MTDEAASIGIAVSCEPDDRYNVTIAATNVPDEAASIATAVSCEADDRHNVTIAAPSVPDEAASIGIAVSCEPDDRYNVTIAATNVPDDAAPIATAASCEADDRHNVTIAAASVPDEAASIATAASCEADDRRQDRSLVRPVGGRKAVRSVDDGLHRFPLSRLIRAKRRRPLPVVLTREEVRKVLGELQGVERLVLTLLYGTGLRLLEGLRLRVTDRDFEIGQITVRKARVPKDRVTMLPGVIQEDLRQHLRGVKLLHEKDLAEGFGRVWLPPWGPEPARPSRNRLISIAAYQRLFRRIG